MDPILVLEEPNLQVEPGAELRTRLLVRSAAGAPERYRLEILGDTARWAQVEPRHLAVAPNGQDRVVEVVFRPPHAATAVALELAFGVRAYSLEHRERAAVVEGTLRVAAVPELTASIDPPTAAGRWGADYRVRFTHGGRVPVALRVTATDPARALRFAVAPAQVTVGPGASADVLVAVRLRAPKLAGAAARHPFAVDHRADTGGSAGRLPAVLEQRAVLPLPVFGVLAVLVAALVAGAALTLFSLPLFGLTPLGGPRAAVPTAAGTTPGSAGGAALPVTTDGGTTGGGTTDAVHGFVVLYGPPTPAGDTVGRADAERFLARLRAAGVDARIVESRPSTTPDNGPRGVVLVLRDGFPDQAGAQAECTAHRDVAPACLVVPPR